MEKTTSINLRILIVIENIRNFFCITLRQNAKIAFIIKRLLRYTYNFFTCFPQKMWKTKKSPLFVKAYIILLIVLVLSGCSYFKGTKKQDEKGMENALISMNEDQIRQRYGEPDMVSKTTSDTILWTYRPSWKIIPDNKDTMYIEFDKGRVIKVLKVR